MVGADAGKVAQCRLNFRISTPRLNATDDVGGEVGLGAVAGSVGVVCAAGAVDPSVQTLREDGRIRGRRSWR